MKKILVMFVMACLTVVMAGCSSSNTPRGVVEQAVKCFMKKDFKGYIDLMDIPEDMLVDREGLEMVLEKELAKDPDDSDIKSYEIIDEEVDEEAGTAKVTVKFVNTNGKEEEEHIDLVKNYKGEWKVKVN